MIFPLFDHNPTRRFPIFTILLIVANVVVFLQCLQLPEQQLRDLLVNRGFIAKRLSHINEPKPVEVVITDARQQRFGYTMAVDARSVYATFFTMMFLHGGWLHLIPNMWMLWVFGNNIEDRLGHFTFLGFYFLGGALAVCAQWASSPESPTPVIGASGAVWAILGAYAVTYPWARVKSLVFVIVPLLLEVPALIVIAAYFAIDLFTVLVGVENGQQAQAVAHWAHLGGCAAGVTLMPLLAIGVSPPESDWRGETDSLLVTGERIE